MQVESFLETSARALPDKTALICNGRRVTYRELDESANRLRLNDIGRVSLRTTQPVFHDPYGRNRLTGGLILIDEATNVTVGAGMITETR